MSINQPHQTTPCARVVTLYYRYGCHLCEDMHDELVRNQQEMRAPFRVEIVDIDEDEQLRQRFNDAVPVLFFQGEEVCRYFFDQATFRQRLNQAV